MTMNRRLTVAALVAAILAISSAAAAAAGFELGEINVGGSVSYGTLTISDFQNYDRYIATLPVFAVSGRYEVLPNVNLLVDYVFGSRALDEDDVYWDDQEPYYVNDYMYRHLSLAGTVGMTKNLDLVLGWTRFTSGYTEEYTEDEWITRNSGSGFKVGLAANVPITDALSVGASYAYMPLMYATTSYPQDGDVTDNYVGQGRELQAGLEYTTGFGLSIRLGFRSEVYSGVADSSQADLYDLSGFRGGFLSVSYSF